MRRLNLFSLLMAFVMAGAAVSPAFAQGSVQKELAQVRRATAKFHSTQAAMAAGYNFVNGLDYCFNNPGVGGMGYHLINTTLLMDGKVDPLRPEAMVYAPDQNGDLHLVAVEYIVPITEGSQPPELFGRTFETNTDLGVYELHAWIFKSNSLGMFNDWNPKVSCYPLSDRYQ
jgi:hypothetical protein